MWPEALNSLLAVLSDLCEKMKDVSAIYLRRKEALRLFGLTNRLLASWQKRRLLPYVKVGRRTTLFKTEDIENFLKKYTVQAQCRTVSERDAR